MHKSISRFLGTTSLNPVSEIVGSNNKDSSKNSKGVTIGSIVAVNCRAGIFSERKHRAPKISKELAKKIEGDQPEFITRHIEERYLKSALNGYFRFGTLVKYRATEINAAGRLGDHQESRIQEVFNSRTNRFNSVDLGDLRVGAASFTGTDKHILVETVVNDFCSCASVGKFDKQRGEEIRCEEKDISKKPTAFVTYNLQKLRAALTNHIYDSAQLSKATLLGRKVEYGEKDEFREVGEDFYYQKDRDSLRIWLDIAFVKPQRFHHEEEYRLLMIDSNGPGGLSYERDTYVIVESASIAESIHESGVY